MSKVIDVYLTYDAKPHSLSNLIIALFAISSIKIGNIGSIPYENTVSSNIYKFKTNYSDAEYVEFKNYISNSTFITSKDKNRLINTINLIMADEPDIKQISQSYLKLHSKSDQYMPIDDLNKLRIESKTLAEYEGYSYIIDTITKTTNVYEAFKCNNGEKYWQEVMEYTLDVNNDNRIVVSQYYASKYYVDNIITEVTHTPGKIELVDVLPDPGSIDETKYYAKPTDDGYVMYVYLDYAMTYDSYLQDKDYRLYDLYQVKGIETFPNEYDSNGNLILSEYEARLDSIYYLYYHCL
jgi:hypothetical protein